MNAMKLPWHGKKVPHGTIDIMGDCNITCKGCYNDRSGKPKPIEHVKKDFRDMMTQRRLHTVTLTGGEATMHPDLVEIVRFMSAQGVKTALVSNGLLIDGPLLKELKTAGIDLILIHVQADQKRPDLPETPTVDGAEKLRNEKLQLIADHGIEAGVAYIIYRDRFDELERLVRRMLSTTHTSFALLTAHADFSKFRNVCGSVGTGLRASAPSSDGAGRAADDMPKMETILEILSTIGLKPFSFVGSTGGSPTKRWYTFLAGTVVRKDGTAVHRGLRSSLLERVAIRLMMTFTGMSPFFHKPATKRLKGQLVLNGLLGGDRRANRALLRESRHHGAVLADKHILLQRAPELTAEGQVIFCENCPDATIRDGVLIPACLVDRMADGREEVAHD